MVRPTSDKRKEIEKHFKWLEQNKCYHCSLCKKTLMGTVKSNFLGNSADHLRRCHLEQYKEIMQTNTAQQVLNFNATAFVDSKKRDRQNLSLLFARTNLPTYIFRGDANQAFLSAIQKTDIIPDWRVIEKEMQEIETYKLSTIKLSASHYSVQLDHWTDHRKWLVLVILLSWVDKNWDHFFQVVDFKRVSRSTALITAEEVKLTITGLGLDPKHCIAYQADNCSAMVRSLTEFRSLTENDNYEDEVDDAFILTDSNETEDINDNDPCRQFVGCGAHRLNNSILSSVADTNFFTQLSAFCRRMMVRN